MKRYYVHIDVIKMIEINIDWEFSLAIVLAYLFALSTGTILVRETIFALKEERQKFKFNTGFIIGICECFIIITLILANEITGLALVFAAKTIVRRGDIEKDPKYYLAGTMVNFTYSLLMGVLIKYLLFS